MQLENPSCTGGLLERREEDVESESVAEGDRREVDVDGADAFVRACGQRDTHERGGGQVDLSREGDQGAVGMIVPVDMQLG